MFEEVGGCLRMLVGVGGCWWVLETLEWVSKRGGAKKR